MHRGSLYNGTIGRNNETVIAAFAANSANRRSVMPTVLHPNAIGFPVMPTFRLPMPMPTTLNWQLRTGSNSKLPMNLKKFPLTIVQNRQFANVLTLPPCPFSGCFPRCRQLANF
jgi:hypothetical protein